jgi:glycosyltransferase involved in cell wall biosynthesis
VTRSPAFSIIVPSYQRRDMVCEAVRALGRLSYYGPIEIIVVVNGSTDGTANALARVNCARPMRLIELLPNRGPAAARNRGAKEASGDILLFLDDDMICEPDLVQQHARFHAAGADVVTGEIPIHRESEPGLITDALTKAAAWRRKPRGSAFDLYSGHFSIRSRLFREIGGFDEEFGARGGFGGEDLELGVRLSRFDLRHNSEAIAWQKSLISPSEHMKRARRLAASDLRVLAKHPEITAELLSNRGAPSSGKAPLAFRLSRVPLLPFVTAATAAWLAETARGTRLQSSPLLARLYFIARMASYWSAFQTRAGKTILRDWRRHSER